jgi:hypothetical protein
MPPANILCESNKSYQLKQESLIEKGRNLLNFIKYCDIRKNKSSKTCYSLHGRKFYFSIDDKLFAI